MKQFDVSIRRTTIEVFRVSAASSEEACQKVWSFAEGHDYSTDARWIDDGETEGEISDVEEVEDNDDKGNSNPIDGLDD